MQKLVYITEIEKGNKREIQFSDFQTNIRKTEKDVQFALLLNSVIRVIKRKELLQGYTTALVVVNAEKFNKAIKVR